MRRAAIYARVSTAKAEQREALKAAAERLRQYIAARNFRLEQRHVYLDTASGGTDDRPAYQAMRSAARSRKVDVIVTTKLDRLARSVRELVNFVAELEALGVDLIVIDQALDTTTPAGRLLFHVLAAVAEFERDLIRDRVCRGLERARARGTRLGRQPKVLDLGEARHLKAQGLSLREIASRLAKITAARDGKAVKVSRAWLSRRLRCKNPVPFGSGP